MGNYSCLFSCLCQSHKRAPLNRFTISFSLFAIISFYSEEVIWLLPNFASNWPSWKLDTKMLCDWASNHWALHMCPPPFFIIIKLYWNGQKIDQNFFIFFGRKKSFCWKHISSDQILKKHTQKSHTPVTGRLLFHFWIGPSGVHLAAGTNEGGHYFCYFFFILQKRSYRISIFCMGS